MRRGWKGLIRKGKRHFGKEELWKSIWNVTVTARIAWKQQHRVCSRRTGDKTRKTD